MTPPARLHFDRHRNRVAVVLDQEDDRKLQVAGGVERLPEFALAGRSRRRRRRSTTSSFVELARRVSIVGTLL